MNNIKSIEDRIHIINQMIDMLEERKEELYRLMDELGAGTNN